MRVRAGELGTVGRRMRKLTQIEFALLNIVIFVVTLPAYFAWGGPSSHVAVKYR